MRRQGTVSSCFTSGKLNHLSFILRVLGVVTYIDGIVTYLRTTTHDGDDKMNGSAADVLMAGSAYSQGTWCAV